MKCDHKKTMCFLEYPDNVMKQIPSLADAIGVCDFEIKEDGILCSVETLDTYYGRILNEMSDDELKGNLQFGFLARGKIKDNLMTDILIPYIVLQCNSFHYPVEHIER